MGEHEDRVLRAAKRLVANSLDIQRVSREIGEGASRCTKVLAQKPDEPTVSPCVFEKVEYAGNYEESGWSELPWYAWTTKTAAEIGAELDYCAECIANVDRFRARKVLKSKRGAYATELQRAVVALTAHHPAPR